MQIRAGGIDVESYKEESVPRMEGYNEEGRKEEEKRDWGYKCKKKKGGMKGIIS